MKEKPKTMNTSQTKDLLENIQHNYDTNQWSKGGMESNGLRSSTDVIDYFFVPGRSNILANPPTADDRIDIPKNTVTSIGIVHTNGLGQVASSQYGNGTLLSSNVQTVNPMGLNTSLIGNTLFNEEKMQYPDYRSTASFLIENLKTNPLSIYCTDRTADVPALFADTKPSDFATYVNKGAAMPERESFTQQIDGSPNVSILNLGKKNGFMGLERAEPNAEPKFPGRVYGGTGSASKISADLYAQGAINKCQNPALSDFSQGYNMAPQHKTITSVGKGHHVPTNLPYGPGRATGNPWTQQGGIWPGRQTTVPVPGGYANIPNRVVPPPNAPSFVNDYSQGGLGGGLTYAPSRKQ